MRIIQFYDPNNRYILKMIQTRSKINQRRSGDATRTGQNHIFVLKSDLEADNIQPRCD